MWVSTCYNSPRLLGPSQVSLGQIWLLNLWTMPKYVIFYVWSSFHQHLWFDKRVWTSMFIDNGHFMNPFNYSRIRSHTCSLGNAIFSCDKWVMNVFFNSDRLSLSVMVSSTFYKYFSHKINSINNGTTPPMWRGVISSLTQIINNA